MMQLLQNILKALLNTMVIVLVDYRMKLNHCFYLFSPHYCQTNSAFSSSSQENKIVFCLSSLRDTYTWQHAWHLELSFNGATIIYYYFLSFELRRICL